MSWKYNPLYIYIYDKINFVFARTKHRRISLKYLQKHIIGLVLILYTSDLDFLIQALHLERLGKKTMEHDKDEKDLNLKIKLILGSKSTLCI